MQQRVDTWIKEYGVRYFSELTNMAVLTEEVGELARVMARKYGDQSFKAGEKENLADEMADVLWVLVCLANQTGVDLTRAVEANFAKKSARDAEFLLTGRQCIKKALFVTAMCAASTVQLISLLRIFP